MSYHLQGYDWEQHLADEGYLVVVAGVKNDGEYQVVRASVTSETIVGEFGFLSFSLCDGCGKCRVKKHKW